MRTIGPADWAVILWSLVSRGLLVGIVGPKPMVPTSFLFSWLFHLPFGWVCVGMSHLHIICSSWVEIYWDNH